MAVVANFLVDTSAAARMSHPEVARILSPMISSGAAATCGPLDFEALYSSRSTDEYASIRRDRELAYEYLPTHDSDWRRALQVQEQLAIRSQLRSVGMPDLLIAAVAERERVTIVHYDRDFERIASITGQPVRWVAAPGSI